MTTKNPADELCVLFPVSPEYVAMVHALAAAERPLWDELLSLTCLRSLSERRPPGGAE